MTRAGKEPAEDVKRAIRHAIEIAGLEVRSVSMHKSQELGGRIILGEAMPTGWPHDQAAIELLATVGFDGAVADVQIRCAATDGDPLLEMCNAPFLQQCVCQLEVLPVTLKEVWIARREVISRLAAGESPPIFDGKWHWKIVSMDLP